MMLKHKKYLRFIIMSAIFFSVFSIVFQLGIAQNPHFDIFDLFMNLASELIALIITVFVVDTYIKMREEVNRERLARKTLAQGGEEAAGGFEVERTEGNVSVRGTSVVRDKRTGVKYLLVVHEHGSALTPLVGQEQEKEEATGTE